MNSATRRRITHGRAPKLAALAGAAALMVAGCSSNTAGGSGTTAPAPAVPGSAITSSAAADASAGTTAGALDCAKLSIKALATATGVADLESDGNSGGVCQYGVPLTSDANVSLMVERPTDPASGASLDFDKTVASITQVVGATKAAPGVDKSQYACGTTSGTKLCLAAVTLKNGTPVLITGSDGRSVAGSEKIVLGAVTVAADSL